SRVVEVVGIDVAAEDQDPVRLVAIRSRGAVGCTDTEIESLAKVEPSATSHQSQKILRAIAIVRIARIGPRVCDAPAIAIRQPALNRAADAAHGIDPRSGI